MSSRSNEAKRRSELTQSMRWRRPPVTTKELAATGIYRPFSLAGVGF